MGDFIITSSCLANEAPNHIGGSDVEEKWGVWWDFEGAAGKGVRSHNEMQHWIFMQSCKQGSLAAVTTSPD